MLLRYYFIPHFCFCDEGKNRVFLFHETLPPPHPIIGLGRPLGPILAVLLVGLEAVKYRNGRGTVESIS